MRTLVLVSLLAAIASGQALAGSPTATISIADGGSTWKEDLGQAGLIQFDALAGNFTMLQGSHGQSITTDNTDWWVWQDAGYWSWHTADTVNGAYMAEIELHSISGLGDPELSYGITVRNNTGRTQTYTIVADETIAPPLGSPNSVFASINGSLTATSGTLQISQSQSFKLQAGAAPLVSAGVDLAPTYSTSSSGSFSALSPIVAGPQNAWDYMQLSTTFTLSGGKGSATLEGYASITPVPEPESYAMLLAGLGMVGVIARRRRVL
jgi:hypothetical protein